MEKNYNGTLVMPAFYTSVTAEEMTYVEGGGTCKVKGTAKYLKNKAAGYMAAWFALCGGYSVTAAVAAGSGVGIALGAIAGLGAGYCGFAGNCYREAYNYFSTKSQKASTKYYMTTITFLGMFVTGVNYGKA